MSKYHIEIQNLVNTALDEMAEEHNKGRLADTPVSNTHFILRWITRAIKGQRFHRVVSGDLIRWQKSGRSKGTQLDLLLLFRQISQLYAKFTPADKDATPVLDSEIEGFIDFMEAKGWAVLNMMPERRFKSLQKATVHFCSVHINAMIALKALI